MSSRVLVVGGSGYSSFLLQKQVNPLPQRFGSRNAVFLTIIEQLFMRFLIEPDFDVDVLRVLRLWAACSRRHITPHFLCSDNSNIISGTQKVNPHLQKFIISFSSAPRSRRTGRTPIEHKEEAGLSPCLFRYTSPFLSRFLRFLLASSSLRNPQRLHSLISVSGS